MQDEFQTGMTKLIDAFGDYHYKTARVELIWYAVKSLSSEAWDNIVTQSISTFRAAPLPKDFQEMAKAERNAAEMEKSDEPEEIEPICPHCFNTGHRWLVDMKSGLTPLVRCGCWNESHEIELPVCNERLIKMFPERDFPLDDFVPVKGDFGSLQAKVYWYIQQKNKSISFWKQKRREWQNA